jgi:tellurite methyltransferase
VSDQDRVRWNQRYAGRTYDFTPAASLVALSSLLRPDRRGARALDLACGGGRNALYLAELGYRVDAWDVSDVGLAILRAELDRRAGAGRPLAVAAQRVDLQAVELPSATYDLVLDYYFLERSLFPAMAAALRPDGLVLVESYLDSPLGHEKMSNPAYRLAPGELRAAFAELDILEYVEDERSGVARLLARRPLTRRESTTVMGRRQAGGDRRAGRSGGPGG